MERGGLGVKGCQRQVEHQNLEIALAFGFILQWELSVGGGDGKARMPVCKLSGMRFEGRGREREEIRLIDGRPGGSCGGHCESTAMLSGDKVLGASG